MADKKLQIEIVVDGATGKKTVQEVSAEIEKIGPKSKEAFDKASRGAADFSSALSRFEDRAKTATDKVSRGVYIIGETFQETGKQASASMARADAAMAKAEAAMKKADKAAADLGREIEKAGKKASSAGADAAQGGNRIAGAMKSAKGAAMAAATAMAAIGAAALAKEAIQMADSYKLVQGRLKLVTSDANELAAVQTKLYAISQNTRIEYGQTVDLYARIARNTKEMKVSHQDLLTVTDAINKSLVISGASSESANAALIQLGQGFASGTLRGEELNSVMEQTPRLAEAIAKGLGITIGELRKYGAEGKLTSEMVLRALKDQADEINAEFTKMPKTVGQSMTQVANSIQQVIGKMDEASGLTGQFSDALTSLSTWIDENEDGLIILGRSLGAVASGILGIVKAGAEIAAMPVQAASRVAKDLQPEAWTRFRAQIALAKAEINAVMLSANTDAGKEATAEVERLRGEVERLIETENLMKLAVEDTYNDWDYGNQTVGKGLDKVGEKTKKLKTEVDAVGNALKSFFGEIDDMAFFDRDFMGASWIENLNRDIENQIDAGNYWELGSESLISSIEKTEAAAIKAAEDSAKAAADAAKEAAEKAQAEYDRFLDGVQRSTADVFFNLFQGVGDGWENLWQGAKNYVLRVLAEIAAAAATRQIVVPIIAATGLMGGSASASGSASGGSSGGTDYLGLASNAYSVYSGYTGNGMLSGIMNTPAWGPGSIMAGNAFSSTVGAGYAPLYASGEFGAAAGAPSLGTLGMYGALGSLGYTTVGDWIGLPQGPYSGIGAGLGAVAGGAGGAALGTAYGFAGGGPYGAVIGAILVGLLSSFIPGEKQPKMKAGGLYELNPDVMSPENLFSVDRTADYSKNLARDGKESIAKSIEQSIQGVLDIYRDIYVAMPEELQEKVFEEFESMDFNVYSKSRKQGYLMEGLEDQLIEAGTDLANGIAGAFRKYINADYIRQEFDAILGRLDENSIFGQSLQILDSWESALGIVEEKFAGVRKISAVEYAQLTAGDRGVVYRDGDPGQELDDGGYHPRDDARDLAKLYEQYGIDANPADFAANAAGELIYLRDYLFDEIFDLSDDIKDRFASMINPMRREWDEAVAAGNNPANDTEFLQYVSDAMDALMKAQAAWSGINAEIDNALEPMGAYEAGVAGINAQFDAYAATLENLEFSQASIDEMEGRRAEVLSRYASDIVEQARLIAEPMTEIEAATKGVNDQFDAMVAGLEKVGDKSAEIAQIETYRAQALDAIAAKEAERTAKELAASMASVAEAQAGIAGRDYRLEVMQGRYGWESIPGMDVLAGAVSAFSGMDYDAVVALADRFGVSVEELTSDMTYLNGIVHESADAAKAEAEARRQSAQAIRDQIAAMREQISMTLYQARGGSMSAYYMGQFRAIQGAPNQSFESLGNAADNLSQWYSAVVSEMQEAARLWAQVGDIATGLIRTIDDTIMSIKTGPLSNALPNQRFASGDAEYRRLRAAATGSEATQADLQAFAGFAQSYLGLAQENFKSSSTYDQVRDNVLSDLESIRGDLASGGYEGAILAELESLNDSLDLTQVNTTFDNLASWIERNIRQLETSGLTLQIDFGDIPEDVRSVLEKWAAVIQENGPNSQLAVDFLVSATAGGTNILWPEFESVIAQMGGSFNTINRMQTIYDDAAGGALPWASVQDLIDANQFGLPIQARLKGEFEGDGLTLSELQEILLASNVSPDLVRKITTELTGTVETTLKRGSSVAVESTPIDSMIASISTQVDRMYGWYSSLNTKLGSIDSSLSGSTLTSSRYISLNNKLGDIAANTAATVSALNNLSAHGDGTVTRGPEIAMIGERGPEAVIPLKSGAVPVQISGGIGGNRPIQLVVQIVDDKGRVNKEQVYEIADEVATVKFRNPATADRRIYG